MLQIGDIHFNHADFDKPLADVKDEFFSEKLASPMKMTEFNYIIKELLNESSDNINAILICGDLSTYGKMDGYLSCLNFLNQRLIKFYSKSSKDHVLIAPGNHDIVRENYSEDSVFPKFKPIIEALTANKFSDFPIWVPKMIEIRARSRNLVK